MGGEKIPLGIYEFLAEIFLQSGEAWQSAINLRTYSGPHRGLGGCNSLERMLKTYE